MVVKKHNLHYLYFRASVKYNLHIGNLFSIRSVTNKLGSVGITTNPVTLSQYLHYLEYAYLVFGVPRYDVKGKRILEGEKK